MEKYGDFCGFTFNGVHSSELNLIRVSDGSRYNDITGPTFQDKTMTVPGVDETYFFNTTYQQKTFAIRIAFDSMSDLQYRRFRQVFNGKDIASLIFDETPYKSYTAKVQNPPQLQTICFNEGGARVYKGEGTINFVCYNPFALSVNKWLSQYNMDTSEWANTSGLLETQGDYDGSGTSIKIYNPGDLPTDWIAFYRFGANNQCALSKITINGTDMLNFNTFIKKGSDIYIGINSKTQLIEGYNANSERTGTIYNEYITSGDFFKIGISDPDETQYFYSTGASCTKLEYHYIYY